MALSSQKQTFFGFIPHSFLLVGIVVVSVYIYGHLAEMDSLLTTQQSATEISNSISNQQLLPTTPTPATTNTINQLAWTQPAQTNQPPFNHILIMANEGFTPPLLKIDNQQLLRVVNNSDYFQVMSFNDVSLMLYPANDYVFALDNLTSGEYQIYADSETGQTYQASIQVL